MISALIPARSGSERVPNKNMLDFFGIPLIAYSILYCRRNPLINEILVSTDSEEIRNLALDFGVDSVILRPKSIAHSKSLDIEWINHLDRAYRISNPFAAIVRPTSPLRSLNLLTKMFSLFQFSECDSIRTIKKVKEHPGKMWTKIENGEILPFLDQKIDNIAFHAMQYASLPKIFVQTSVLEIFKVSSMRKHGSREGLRILGYETFGTDSWAIDEAEDWIQHKSAVERDSNLRIQLDTLLLEASE
jgi:CMP-N,N'-diacetyllegionaminic acid synthase